MNIQGNTMCNDINMQNFNNILIRFLEFDYINSRRSFLSSDWTEGWHRSPWSVLTYCHSGITETQLKDPDCAYRITSGELSVIPTERMKYGYIISGEKVVVDWLNFRFMVMNSIDMLSLIEVPNKLTGEIAESIGQLIVKINKAVHETPGIATSVIVKSHAFKILAILLENFPITTELDSIIDAHNHFKIVIDYISENYHSQISCEILAKLANMSKATFFRKFKQCLKVTPYQYITSLRLKEARYMLASGTETIGEIAASLGFCDQFQFSRIFRRYCGASPLTYRQQQHFHSFH